MKSFADLLWVFSMRIYELYLYVVLNFFLDDLSDLEYMSFYMIYWYPEIYIFTACFTPFFCSPVFAFARIDSTKIPHSIVFGEEKGDFRWIRTCTLARLRHFLSPIHTQSLPPSPFLVSRTASSLDLDLSEILSFTQSAVQLILQHITPTTSSSRGSMPPSLAYRPEICRTQLVHHHDQTRPSSPSRYDITFLNPSSLVCRCWYRVSAILRRRRACFDAFCIAEPKTLAIVTPSQFSSN